MSDLNWDLLRYFDLVARHGSVSQAARAAGVSHATVLRAINRLEKTLSARLFDHIQTGYRLTPRGEELVSHVSAIVDEVIALERRARAGGDQPGGEIRMSLPDPGLTDLMPVLRSFQDSHPDVSFSLVDITCIEESTFMTEGLKVAFTLTNSPPDSLVGRQLGTVTLVPSSLNGSDDSWVIWGNSDELREAQRATILRYSRGKISMTTSTHEQAEQAMRSGGAALLSDRLPEEMRLESKARISLGLWVLTHPDLRRDINVISLLRYLADFRL